MARRHAQTNFSIDECQSTAEAYNDKEPQQINVSTARVISRTGLPRRRRFANRKRAVRCGTYNDANCMAQVLSGTTVLADYAYNGKGEQVLRIDGGGPVHFVYDEAGHLLGQYDSASHAIQEYLWLDDLPVGVVTGGQVYYVESDHLGTPRAVIDPVRQKAVWAWPLTGEAFGATAPNQDADGDDVAFTLDLRFPGQRYDAVSGLNYNYFRDYEPGTGRYVESDPIGLLGGANTYVYADQNPLTEFDSNGLIPCTCKPLLNEGAGYRNHRKFCTYSCSCTCANGQNFTTKLIAPGSNGSPTAQVCIGQREVITYSRVEIAVGVFATHATPSAVAEPFSFDTDQPYIENAYFWEVAKSLKGLIPNKCCGGK